MSNVLETFLDIVRKTAKECGVGGASSGTVPSSVTNQTGELSRLVGYCSDAYLEIQNKHIDWRWLRSTFTVNTVAGTQEYEYDDCTDVEDAAKISRFSRWLISDIDDPAKIYLEADGIATQRWIPYTPWNWFKSIYLIGGNNEVTGMPAHISVTPKNRIVLGYTPDDIYTLSGDYQRSAQVLNDDSDEPEMPAQFYLLIVYRAMEKYALNESAQEILMRAQEEGRRMMNQLEGNQLPQMTFAGPAA